MTGLHPLHLEDLRKSGLSDLTIKEADIKTVPPNDINKKLGFNIPDLISCYEIPYDETSSRFKAFYADNSNSTPKYLQRKGTGNRLYIPQRVKPILNDPTVPLKITEGEKKALKACQEGLYCIAVSGLWNWSNGKKELISEFDQIAFEGRTIYIIPDNDWLQPNKHGYIKNLKQAVYELADRLKIRGAKVFIVELPQGELKGLDDFLCNHTIEEFKSLSVFEIKSLSERIAEAATENYKPLIKEIIGVVDPIDRDILCKKLAKKLDIPVDTIRNVVNPRKESIDNFNIIVEEIKPWEEQVDGNAVLDTLYNIIQKHIVLEPPAITATTLWIVLSYCYDSFRILPILGITSPEKRCGKTTLLEVLAGLTYKPLLASNMTTSVVFRTIEKFKPCLLIDEADTFLKDNEELRGVLNSGHTRKAAFVIRTNPNSFEPERFSTWTPKAISLICKTTGSLPDTLSDRAIGIKMKRKIALEKVERVTQDFDDQHLGLRRQIKRWVTDNEKNLKDLTPIMPETGNDRATDNWLPLLCIATLAGGEWPDRARKAMFAIEKVSDEDTLKQILLRDIREFFDADARDRISSKKLVEELIQIEDHPWGEWGKQNRPITQNGFARLLKPFGIASKKIREGDDTFRGYTLDQFVDVFNRYIPPTPFQSGTVEQPAPVKGLLDFQSGTQKEKVPLAKQREATPVKDCSIVPLETTFPGGRKKHIKDYEEVEVKIGEIKYLKTLEVVE